MGNGGWRFLENSQAAIVEIKEASGDKGQETRAAMQTNRKTAHGTGCYCEKMNKKRVNQGGGGKKKR